MLRPFVHPVACCWMLLRVVAQSLKPVKLLASYRRTPQLPTTMLGVVCQQCCIRLHTALRPTVSPILISLLKIVYHFNHRLLYKSTGHPRCNIILSFSLFCGLLSGLGSLLIRKFLFSLFYVSCE